jgi:succinoglycan biosynthesis protein ExoV
MRLHYYRAPKGNFGDDLNPWLWPRLFPLPLDQCFDDATLLLGIGSILNDQLPDDPVKRIVFGSGCGYGTTPRMTRFWQVYCVRGPLSAEALGLPPAAAICDGAMLVRELVEPVSRATHEVSFMPHHVSARIDDWRSVCDSLGFHYIDPSGAVDDVIGSIRSSELVITEALHGAIVADAFRIPWIPVRSRPHILAFKWHDWAGSMGLEHSFEFLPRIWNRRIGSRAKRGLHLVSMPVARARLRWLSRYGRKRLSEDRVFSQVYSRLRASLSEMCEDTWEAAVREPVSLTPELITA